MTKAIILSAGQGKRLMPLTEDRPKCLIPFSGYSLLEWQLRALAANAVSEAVVVTGFGHREVETAISHMQLSGIRIHTLYNPFYSVADNIASCWIARDWMDDDFLLINGDTLFEEAIIETLLAEAVMPISLTIDIKERYDSDDMKVCFTGPKLDAVGKTLPLDEVNGESIGVSRFQGDGGRLFAAILERTLLEPEGLRLWYLSVINQLAQDGNVGIVPITGRAWAEVDFPHDLRAAEALTSSWASLPLGAGQAAEA